MSRRTLLLAALLVTSGVAAAQTYYYSPFSSGPDPTKWNVNGTFAAVPGLTTSGSASAISTVPVPDGTAEYEVRSNFLLQQNGGSYVMYVRATPDSLLTPTTSQGTFFAVELTDVQVTAGTCSATVRQWKRQAGVLTMLGSATIQCASSPQYYTSLRVVMRNYIFIVYGSDGLPLLANYDLSIASGQPGLGVSSAPANNRITMVELVVRDVTGPSNPTVPGVTAFDTKVEMQWSTSVDPGSGIYAYHVFRKRPTDPDTAWVFLHQPLRPTFADTTVAPSTTYQYWIFALDYHLNYSSGRLITVETAPANSNDPRQIGIQPTGAYWGAAGEQIDLRSGNLNFTLPLVQVQSRGGWGFDLTLHYNSQNWRKDSAGIWPYGRDNGYGYGWQMTIGSIMPVYVEWYTVHHYVYRDSTGAEHRLDVNTNGLWTSRDGIYVTYDPSTRRLWWNDGSFWQFDCESGASETDGGVRYPTLMQDSNGNQLRITYETGAGGWFGNTSSRPIAIEDVRRGWQPKTYSFTYENQHLRQIKSYIQGEIIVYTLNYQSPVSIGAPWPGAEPIEAHRLISINKTGIGDYSFVYSSSGELSTVVNPLGGTVRWEYRDFTFAGNRTLREVQRRYLRADPAQAEQMHLFGHDDAGDQARSYHAWTSLANGGLPGDKVWSFNADRRLETYEERGAGAVVKNRKHFVWAYSNPGNSQPFVYQVTTTLDPGTAQQKQSRVQQMLDTYGNVTQVKQYDFGLAEADARVYTNQYLAGTNWTSRYIRNRLKVTTLNKGGISVELVRNAYDNEPRPGCGSTATLQQIPGNNQILHDLANYTWQFDYRGNPTLVQFFSNTSCMTYDFTGTLRGKSDNSGTMTMQTQSGTNYTVPSLVTANGYSSTLNWTPALQLSGMTGPNGESIGYGYDIYNRPSGGYSPYGATTTYGYAAGGKQIKMTISVPNPPPPPPSPPGYPPPPPSPPAQPDRWTKTYLDGFGRTVKVESGYMQGTTEIVVSVAEREYEACACTPMGKLKRISQPHGPGQAVVWTEYVYDELGRLTQIKPPANAGAGFGTPTTYTYAGNTVTVTDPGGIWKRFTLDAFGALTTVHEPRPGGGEYATAYQYTLFNQLSTVTMTRDGVTQVRTFTYGPNGQIASTTFPENGTTTYTYGAYGLLIQKQDAKGQKITYEYDNKRRLTVVKKDRLVGGIMMEEPSRVTYYYDSNPFDPSMSVYTTNRVAAVQYQTGPTTATQVGTIVESYQYDRPGAIMRKRMESTKGWRFESGYTYDKEGRLASIAYPNGGKTYVMSYDASGRPNGMKHQDMVEGEPVTVTDVWGVNYNPAGQMTGISYGSDFNFYSEGRGYNNRQQLTWLNIYHYNPYNQPGAPLNQQYNYPAANAGRIASMSNLISGETVTYQYDSLARLSSAGSPHWTQAYTYDGFGNMYKKTGTGLAAAWAWDATASLNSAKNQFGSYDANGNPVGASFDVENRMTGTWYHSLGYAPDNKRVARVKDLGSGEYEVDISFYSGNNRLGTYRVAQMPDQSWTAWTLSEEKYFAGRRLAAQDRLGSASDARLLPYGEELSATPNDRVKFATYTRDNGGGDYADQRYYSPGGGRFVTPDPYMASGGVLSPSSWNRYAYVEGDPVNAYDPTGESLAQLVPAGEGGRGGSAGWLGFITFGLFGGNKLPADYFDRLRPVTREQREREENRIKNLLLAAVAAAVSEEQEDRPYPKYLLVKDDNYSCFGKGIAQRNITYDLYDSENNRVDGVITEHLRQIDYDAEIVRGNTTSGRPNGVFADEISIQWGYPRTYLQSFTVRGSSVGLAGFTDVPVYVDGFGSQYGILNITKRADYIEINGNRGQPKKCN
jgi:RHS repeat-associated protein